MTEKVNVICRCEEIEIEEIRKWIDAGYTNFEELKRIIHVGMGPCQGRGCRDIILRELSKSTGKPIADLLPGVIRPPVKPIKAKLLAEDSE